MQSLILEKVKMKSTLRFEKQVDKEKSKPFSRFSTVKLLPYNPCIQILSTTVNKPTYLTKNVLETAWNDLGPKKVWDKKYKIIS
jgi:hypothetical protein